MSCRILDKLFNSCATSSRDTRLARRYEDRLLAQELQRQDYLAERRRRKALKRKERKAWYEYYLAPYTMVVSNDDFVCQPCPQQDDRSIRADEIDETSKSLSPDDFSDSEDEDIPVPREVLLLCNEYEEEPLRCRPCDDGTTSRKLLRLPDNWFAGRRVVDGTCSCCLEDYREGDRVVYSPMGCCPHAFHHDCLLAWLSQGKKKCPLCRHWFVPPARLQDQQKAHGAAWDAAKQQFRAAAEATAPFVQDDEEPHSRPRHEQLPAPCEHPPTQASAAIRCHPVLDVSETSETLSDASVRNLAALMMIRNHNEPTGNCHNNHNNRHFGNNNTGDNSNNNNSGSSRVSEQHPCPSEERTPTVRLLEPA